MKDENTEVSAMPLPTKSRSRRISLIAPLLGLALAVSLGFVWYQHRSVQQLTASRDQLLDSLSQTKARVELMSAQLSALAAAPRRDEPVASAPAPAADAAPRAARRTVAQRARVARAPAEDPRWKKINSELAQTRSDLESSIKSSHDELNDSIAKTHDELVTLSKKGERDYSEFELTKSKQFVRTGPISLSLRKTNVKHVYCDLEVRVDDNQISKKHVNLYEPVFVYQEGYSQPLELVINRIDKNQIKGYVSKPKYGKQQVASTNADGSESGTASAAAQPSKPRPVLAPRH